MEGESDGELHRAESHFHRLHVLLLLELYLNKAFSFEKISLLNIR